MSAADVLLATFELCPDGESEGHLLVEALADRGVAARWAVWDDASVDWDAADLVAVRSTWDYHRRLPEFLAWAEGLRAPVLNGADAFAWNAHKGYLATMGEHVPTVPTRVLEQADLVDGLRRAVDQHGTVVIKPATGAGGVGVCVVERWDDHRLEHLSAAPWVVQPLVESVRTRGETSVYVFDDVAVCQVDKHPAEGEVRVHGAYGGRSEAVVLDPVRADRAMEAVRAAEDVLGHRLDYARVDLLWWEDRWCLSELELIEPGLYLGVVPGNAEAFADLVVRTLAQARARS